MVYGVLAVLLEICILWGGKRLNKCVTKFHMVSDSFKMHKLFLIYLKQLWPILEIRCHKIDICRSKRKKPSAYSFHFSIIITT